IFYYYCIHLRVIATPSFILDISDHWEAKRAAIECYQSQFVTGRPTDQPTIIDRIRDQAAYWGWAINRRYGEPFACKEAIGMSGFDELL
ncbi:MAG: bacillithiol biosynthesis deacetylase BshB1, partial [Planctomycetota bacterium]|nr:bacillithiol biosynthesis deacetylase BshB1 [Planctomycetota bacterium]